MVAMTDTGRAIGGLLLGSMAVVAMLHLTSFPGDSQPVELQGMRTFSLGEKPEAETRTNKNGEVISPKNLPQPFLDAAKRAQLEAAIRAAAAKLEQQRDEKAELEHEYDEAAASAVKEGANAELLHEQAKQQAATAVEEHTKAKVANDKIGSEKERMELEKKIATLMTFKSRHLKDEADKATESYEDGEKQAARLRAHASQLKETAQSEGKNANAIVRTAKELLASARQLSTKAARAAAAETDTDGEQKTLLERLHREKKTAHAVYEKDMEELAKAQLKMKGLTGVEGIDAVSRTQERIADAQKKIHASGVHVEDDANESP